MRTQPLIPNSIWTAPQSNRQFAWARASKRAHDRREAQQRAAYLEACAQFQKWIVAQQPAATVVVQ